MESKKYKTKRLDHLGLVAGFCKEIGLAEWVDEQFPKKSHRSKVSYGTLLVAMILNNLGFVSRTLHMYPEYFRDKPVERLLGEGIEASQLNDDVIGRFLDKLYESGVSGLYEKIAYLVVRHLGLPCQSLNWDTTSFHVDGAYEEAIDAKKIHLTRGYSRDHRPDLNQVVLSLITENQAGIPLYMKACSGNAQDTQILKKVVQEHLRSLKSAYQNNYLIGDAALYTEENIQALAAEEQYFITRVPHKLKEAKALLEKENVQWTTLPNGYEAAWFSSKYGNVSQRWLLVKSAKAQAREISTLEKQVAKAKEAARKSFKKLCQRSFSCEADAFLALKVWVEQQKFVCVADIKIHSETKYKKAGRPPVNEKAPCSFHLSGTVEIAPALLQRAKQRTGFFILATNAPSELLDMQRLLEEYKSQQAVERGFRFLKSPDFLVASLFLKKPERIEALLMVMTCSLMIYAAIEYLIRQQLKQQEAYFPDMKNKPYQKPTARWVFFCFQGIDELAIGECSSDPLRLILNLSDTQKTILLCLGKSYQDFYS